MNETFEFTLNNPLTEEQWDMITDVDFDRTDRITFHTKHGKEVEFAKVIRCKDCKYVTRWRSEESARKFGQIYECRHGVFAVPKPDDFCSRAERKEE